MTKGGIILEIYDSENDIKDVYDNDFFGADNKDFGPVTVQSTVEVPKLRDTWEAK